VSLAKSHFGAKEKLAFYACGIAISFEKNHARQASDVL
jgi:hypothetical protein